MKLSGSNLVHAPLQQTWDALLDPAVLVRALPGCERLVAVGENAYDMTVTAGVASIKGTYDGHCELSDLEEPRSLVMKLQGAGAPGTIGATVDVAFEESEAGTTIAWSADAVVGGMVGGVGQRMLTSVAKRMAGEFFGNVDGVIAAGPSATAPTPAAAAGTGSSPDVPDTEDGPRVFTAPAAATRGGDRGDRQDFLLGIAVGAGLVLAGAVVGAALGRRS